MEMDVCKECWIENSFVIIISTHCQPLELYLHSIGGLCGYIFFGIKVMIKRILLVLSWL
jgi:hypothetical protein